MRRRYLRSRRTGAALGGAALFFTAMAAPASAEQSDTLSCRWLDADTVEVTHDSTERPWAVTLWAYDGDIVGGPSFLTKLSAGQATTVDVNGDIVLHWGGSMFDTSTDQCTPAGSGGDDGGSGTDAGGDTDTGGDTTGDGTDTSGDTTGDGTDTSGDTTGDGTDTSGDTTGDGTDTSGDTTGDGTDTSGDTTGDGTDTSGDTTGDGTDTSGDTTGDGTDTSGDTVSTIRAISENELATVLIRSLGLI